MLRELDNRFPGMRFRIIDEQDGIRPHIKLFVNTELVADLNRPLGEHDEVHIICALSGG
jgi:molybdopterin converting factor small subunit